MQDEAPASAPEKLTSLGELMSHLPSDDVVVGGEGVSGNESERNDNSLEPDEPASKPLPKRMPKRRSTPRSKPNKPPTPPSSSATSGKHSPANGDGRKKPSKTNVPTGRQRVLMLRARAASMDLPDLTSTEKDVVMSLCVGGGLEIYQKDDGGEAEQQLAGQASPRGKCPPPLPKYIQRRKHRTQSFVSYTEAEHQSSTPEIEPKPAAKPVGVELTAEKTVGLHVSIPGSPEDSAGIKLHRSPRRKAVIELPSSSTRTFKLSPPPPIPSRRPNRKNPTISPQTKPPLSPSSLHGGALSSVNLSETIVAFYIGRISEFLNARYGTASIPEDYLDKLYEKFPHIGYQIYKAPATGTLTFLAGQFDKLEKGNSFVSILPLSGDSPISSRTNRPVCIGQWLVKSPSERVVEGQDLFELLCVSMDNVPLVVREYRNKIASEKLSGRQKPSKISIDDVESYEQFDVVFSDDEDSQFEEDSTNYGTPKREQDDDKEGASKRKFESISELYQAVLSYREQYGEGGYLEPLRRDYSNIDYELFMANYDGTRIIECTTASFIPVSCEMLIMKVGISSSINSMWGADEYVLGRRFAIKDTILDRGSPLYELLGVVGIQQKPFLFSKDGIQLSPKKPTVNWSAKPAIIGKTLQRSSEGSSKSKPKEKLQKTHTLTNLKNIVFGNRTSGHPSGTSFSVLPSPRSLSKPSSSSSGDLLSRSSSPSLIDTIRSSLSRHERTPRKPLSKSKSNDGADSETAHFATPRSRKSQ